MTEPKQPPPRPIAAAPDTLPPKFMTVVIACADCLRGLRELARDGQVNHQVCICDDHSRPRRLAALTAYAQARPFPTTMPAAFPV